MKTEKIVYIFIILTVILREIAIFLWYCIANNAAECVTYCKNVSSTNWFGIKVYSEERMGDKCIDKEKIR